MSTSKASSARQNLEKQLSKSTYLENAIQNLSSLLGQNFSDSNNEIIQDSPMKSMELKDEDIDHYITVLTERLMKIQENLTKEESLLFNAQEENIDLKAKWSEEVKKQENTLKLGKSEIIKLSDQNKELLNDMHAQLKDKEFLVKENTKINGELEKIKLECEKMKIIVHETKIKDENQLNEEVNELKILIKKEEDLKNLQEKNNEFMKKEINELGLTNENYEKKSRGIKERIGKLEREKNCDDEKNSKFLSDYKSSMNKKNKLNKKLEELEMIEKKFEEEIILKNQQMELGRKKNQNLEIKKIKFDSLNAQISFEKEINLTLQSEKEILSNHLEKLLSDINHNPISNESHNYDKNFDKKISGLNKRDNFIEELKKSQNFPLNLYDRVIDLPLERFEEYHKILDENVNLEETVQELEIKLADKQGLVDDVDKENNIQNYEIKKMMLKMEENKTQKGKLLEKYSVLEKELKDLSIKEKLNKFSIEGSNNIGNNNK